MQTIINMAHNKAIKGMPINLSSLPAKCDSCILRKQTCLLVPKTWKGNWADTPLERVHVNLYSPMPCASYMGHFYFMNAIDDHTGYIWSLPLRLKLDAAIMLRHWHCVIENQLGHKLKILIIDNGKLIPKFMTDWCADHGIDHQLTAPYMSAQNGHAECLH